MIFPARHFLEAITVQRPFQKNMNPSPDDVSPRTCVSKRLVVGGGGNSETMSCEAIKGDEVGRGRGPMKSVPLPPHLGIPRCSHFYGLGQRVRSSHLIEIHEWCGREPKKKGGHCELSQGCELSPCPEFPSRSPSCFQTHRPGEVLLYPKPPNPILTQCKQPQALATGSCNLPPGTLCHEEGRWQCQQSLNVCRQGLNPVLGKVFLVDESSVIRQEGLVIEERIGEKGLLSLPTGFRWPERVHP